ncbi:hypothetical protein SARC_00144 [Sphaeroforma arctica JP610]|uniref:Helicase C-terminal domain-containing protein n=1 Tax=Sphaeroforma arctica JP610 TaxID=667725 RepID=A0A0L0GFG7_9EUKA|nr:hypothetical protein SARC_00144 [Sphaeroforma arctica JP610]KNC87772.1 hypothetical protein SARC_00144 [Sphaeroforma arctica JP610]|eukprot:XP_014161674.1 hypothetical protein SARC_00144 [Sphaeroforma arctica JP610]
MATIAATLPEMEFVATPNVHKADSNVTHEFIRLRGHDDTKQEALKAQLFGQTGSVIVFCNTYRTCDWVSSMLNEAGKMNYKMHGCQDSKVRTTAIDEFQKQKKGILVCTDIASRGIDTRNVNKVIMFDFPTSVADYLHRAGRTGRLGSKGTVVSLYSTKNAEHVYRIENAVKHDKTLSGLFKKLTQSERPKTRRPETAHSAFQVDGAARFDDSVLNPKDDITDIPLEDEFDESTNSTIWV